jgi:prepilin-type N-terminal cleavage/methylation domain-containing protein
VISSSPRISLRSEAGFTLVELLVAMVIGGIVLIASLTVLDASVSLTTKVNSRVDALQRGRAAMDLVVRDLRSQVCVGILTNASTNATSTEDSLIAGSSTSVDFYADLGDGTAAQPPTRRTLTFDPNARTITEKVYKPTGNVGAYVFPSTASPTSTRILLTDVVQDGTTPVFGFYAYDTATPRTPSVLLASPLSATDEQRTVKIAIAFKALRTGGTASSPGAASLQDDVFRRNVDPNDTDSGPECSA